jgi:DHA2 family multidrug resistance protein
MITISIMLATIMQALDTTIANVALPHMQGSLQASQDQITWVLTSYIVASAIALPLTGWLCAQWGRRKVFIVSVVGFTIASALCGLATSLAASSARAAAGHLRRGAGAAVAGGAAGHQPAAEGRPGHGDLGRRHHGRAHPRAAAGRLAHRELRLALGVLHQPAGRPVRAVGHRPLPAGEQAGGQKLDMFGFVALSLAIGLLQLLLDRGELLDWFDSWEIKLEAAGAVVAFAFFAVHTWTVQGVSFFDRDLLKDRNFVTGLLFGFIVGIVLYGTMALLPTFLQTLMAYPVVYTGMVTAPRGIGTMLAMIVVGRLVQRKVDLRMIMATGFMLTAFSLWQMTHITLQMDSSLIVMVRLHPGAGHRLHLRAAVGGHLRHAGAAAAQRGHADLQPAAQHRRQRRHLDRAGAADARRRRRRTRSCRDAGGPGNQGLVGLPR